MKLARRLISSSAVARLPRNPVVNASWREIRNSAISAQTQLSDHTEYAPEFAINKQVAEEMEPWVPERERKRFTAQRQQSRLEQERREQLDSLAKQVAEFNLTSSPAATTAESADVVHPDVMQAYRDQVEQYRQRYARELDEKKQRIQSEQQDQQQRTELRDRSGSETANQTKQKSLEADEATAVQEALDLLQRYSLKTLQHEKHLDERQRLVASQKESVVRLYHRSHSFITSETLESAIEKCLLEPKPFPSYSIQDLQGMAVEERKKQREIKLYDSLNDTLNQGESVASMERQRRMEAEAAAAVKQADSMRQSE